MKSIILIILILLFFTFCNEKQVSEPASQTPHELWLSHNIHNYSVYQWRSCFCPDAGKLVKVTVKSDTLYSVIRISDNSPVSYPFYYSIDSLFGIINNSVDDSLVIEYNSKYGFPKFLDINPQLHPVDGGVLYETSNLVIQQN